ncbi:hypothetical protein [Limosilactobacillus antri]|uniref:Uncharacterized protein n=1 Tax=Limosilactobacillus antri DSM 16041 TaxID=525309 RepID=C8P457_9LACO|nr:hypothetical protein [Limosilactobacillus antri]EEW54724.1 hypothetical protein HMPREF0494_0101 [Limosilactobacillus antri DSM 16041]KRK60652.1 hypothetical protein FC31_GL000678 [Limosilactobacillus antri DSM 16041]
MSKQKMTLVMTNVFHRLGQAILITVGWIVGFEVVVSLMGLIFNRNPESFLVTLQGIPSTLAVFINLVLLAYFIVTPYVDFKWAIQNGISRKTMWRGRALALFLATLVIFILDELLSMANQPAMSPRTLLVNFLILLTGVVTCQAVGNGFSLLNRTWKWIVGIGLPVMFIIFCVIMVRLILAMGSQITALVENKQFVAAMTVVFNNPVLPYVLWLIYFAIMLGLTKLFNDRMQLRRD